MMGSRMIATVQAIVHVMVKDCAHGVENGGRYARGESNPPETVSVSNR